MSDLTADRVYGLLLDAYTEGFLLEHGMKNASRHPLSGAGSSFVMMRERLRPDFHEWLFRTPKLGDAEATRIKDGGGA